MPATVEVNLENYLTPMERMMMRSAKLECKWYDKAEFTGKKLEELSELYGKVFAYYHTVFARIMNHSPRIIEDMQVLVEGIANIGKLFMRGEMYGKRSQVFFDFASALYEVYEDEASQENERERLAAYSNCVSNAEMSISLFDTVLSACEESTTTLKAMLNVMVEKTGIQP